MQDPLLVTLEALRRGVLEPREAQRRIARLAIRQVGDRARLDLLRHHRTGAPEVVYGRNKEPRDLLRLLRELAGANHQALATGATPAHAHHLKAHLPPGFTLTHNPRARTLWLRRKGYRPPKTGRAGILTAGTSDIPVAEEANVTLQMMGVETRTAYDVGVAGIHRLYTPLQEMQEWGARALIAVAGMEGVLPTVVAGLVDVPVIGVPTSVGYGVGGQGVGALITMLQSCAPGLAVVNVDNGFGAGVVAGMIAKASQSPGPRSSKKTYTRNSP
ncbi:MAG: nickel pincer cofactor biosynthesis protein LarB [Euryarchaeota archaeon]|nr:nickel pincer cofactor biosynthesis protein LarB [Euryarchaeota archaeon]